jgi:DNA-binding NarL/FixJ family response regulator
MGEPDPLRVVLVDDHDLVRAGMRAVLDGDPRFTVVAEASDGAEGVAVTQVHHPDVVVMDLQMPNMSGIEATRRILAARPGTAVLVLTMFDDDDSVYSAVRAGARGYLLKGAGREEVRSAVAGVAGGQAVFGPGIAERILDAMLHRPAAAPEFPELTPREREILELMTEGATTATMARRLDLAEKTVRNNVSSILTKLQVSDRVAAVEAARAAGVGKVHDNAFRYLLFTDIGGSTRLVRALGADYPELLTEHNALVDAAIERHSGVVFGSAGDARFAWFTDGADALLAAQMIQQKLSRHAFPGGVEVQVRIGIHAGEITNLDGEMIGLALHETARVASAASPGLVLVSSEALPDPMPAGIRLGPGQIHELRDLDRPLTLHTIE